MMSSARIAAAALTIGVAAFSSAQQIKVQVDGAPLYFANAQPQYVDGRVLVPLRSIFERLGATVNWDRQTRMIDASRGGSQVELRIGDRQALVNGNTVTLDVPAMIVNGATLVPIRFVSESLGAQVGWMEAERLVTINTTASPTDTAVITQREHDQREHDQRIKTPPHRLRRIMIRQDEVIPVTLDETLSTETNRRGDKFTATVRTEDRDEYADIPRGTKVEGRIIAIHKRTENQPAIIDVTYNRLRFPNGHTVKIDGSLTALDEKHVMRGENGMISYKSDNRDQRMVYAGYGAGAGLLVGVLSDKPLEGAILGGAVGYIIGQVQHDQQKRTENVRIPAGTEMGIRIHSDVATDW